MARSGAEAAAASRPHPDARHAGAHEGCPLLVPPGAPLASTQRGVAHLVRWANSPAVAKIMPTHEDEATAYSHAVEMAVLSSVQHPNVVQAYSCMTDMVQAPDDDDADSVISVASQQAPPGAEGGRLFMPPGLPGHEGDCPTFNILVMELCEGGTLQEALVAAPAAAPAIVGAAAAVGVLTDVASALTFLHAMRLAHGNVKAENVLLKADPMRSVGYTAKLGGFGSARLIFPDDDGGPAGPPASHATPPPAPDGAPRAAAPASEALLESDVGSFGLLIQEVLQSALHSGGQGPSPFLRALARLAADCLHSDPRQRPSMADVARTLEALSEELEAAA